MQKYKTAVLEKGSLNQGLEYVIGVGPNLAGMGLKLGPRETGELYETFETRVLYNPAEIKSIGAYATEALEAHKIMKMCLEETLKRISSNTKKGQERQWKLMENYATERRRVLPADLRGKEPMGSDRDYMQICKRERWGAHQLIQTVRRMSHVISFGQRLVQERLEDEADKTPEIEQLLRTMDCTQSHLRRIREQLKQCYDGYVRVQRLLGYSDPKKNEPLSFESKLGSS